MNSIELKKELVKMLTNFFSNPSNAIKNMHTCFYVSIIEVIMTQYMTRCDYYEEDAIKTFQGFLEKGIINW